MVNKELLAPCGLYCGVCGVYMAHRDNDLKLKEKLARFFGVPVESLSCKGCLSNELAGFCKSCLIRECTRKKTVEGCHECDDFPCDYIENFPIPLGKKVILRSIPEWRQMGTEKWVEAVENRYLCPECGNALFRGAKHCRNCKTRVNMDWLDDLDSPPRSK